MDKLPKDVQDNIQDYRNIIQESDNNFIVLEDGFGAGKTTASMTLLEKGDAIVFDTHAQAKEKMDDYTTFFSEKKCIHLASLQKYIGQFNWKRKGIGEKQNVNIPSKLEKKMKNIPTKNLLDFKNKIEENTDEPYSPKFISIKNDMGEDIKELADIYSNLYNEKNLSNKIVFSVKNLISVFDHEGKIYIDESLYNSKNRKKVEDLLSVSSNLEKYYIESKKIGTFKYLKNMINQAYLFLKIFYQNFSSKSELHQSWTQINEKIMEKEFDDVPLAEFEMLRDFDRNKYMEKFYDIYVKRDDKEKYPELQALQMIEFASELYKYGGRVQLDGGMEVEVAHEFVFDLFEKGMDNQAVLMDAEFDPEWFKEMFEVWNLAEKGGVSLEDKGIEEVELLEDEKVGAEYHYLNIGGSGGNSTIRMNCYSYYDKADKYIKKHYHLRILSEIIKHKDEYSDDNHGVVTTLKGKKNLFSDFDNCIHFAEMEGSNKLKDVDVLWVIGTPRVGNLKKIAEENFRLQIDSIEEIADGYEKDYYDFIVPSTFDDKNLKGKSDFKRAFEFEISDDDKKKINYQRTIWNLQILAKVRQAIGRKRDMEKGKVVRVGINHHSFHEKFEKKSYDTIKSFIKEEFKEYPGSRIPAKENLNWVLEEKKQFGNIIDYIPQSIRKHFSDKGKAGKKIELGRKPRGYNKENYVKYLSENDYSMREIERETRLSKDELNKLL